MRNMSLFFIIQDIILWLLMIGVIVGIVYLIVKFVGSILSIPEEKEKRNTEKEKMKNYIKTNKILLMKYINKHLEIDGGLFQVKLVKVIMLLYLSIDMMVQLKDLDLENMDMII